MASLEPLSEPHNMPESSEPRLARSSRSRVVRVPDDDEDNVDDVDDDDEDDDDEDEDDDDDEDEDDDDDDDDGDTVAVLGTDEGTGFSHSGLGVTSTSGIRCRAESRLRFL